MTIFFQAEETNSTGWCRTSSQTTSARQDRRRVEYVFVWTIPLLAGVGLKLVSQASKGIEDNVNHYCRRGRSGYLYVPSWRAFSTSPVISNVNSNFQRRSDQRDQQDDLESVKEENPCSAVDLRQTQKTQKFFEEKSKTSTESN